jgi:hypothetical protein
MNHTPLIQDFAQGLNRFRGGGTASPADLLVTMKIVTIGSHIWATNTLILRDGTHDTSDFRMGSRRDGDMLKRK